MTGIPQQQQQNTGQGKRTYRSETVKPWTQQHELNRVKKIGFSASISSNDTVGSRREGVDLGLLLERTEIVDGDLLDVHCVSLVVS